MLAISYRKLSLVLKIEMQLKSPFYKDRLAGWFTSYGMMAGVFGVPCVCVHYCGK